MGRLPLCKSKSSRLKSCKALSSPLWYCECDSPSRGLYEIAVVWLSLVPNPIGHPTQPVAHRGLE